MITITSSITHTKTITVLSTKPYVCHGISIDSLDEISEPHRKCKREESISLAEPVSNQEMRTLFVELLAN